MVNIMVRKSVIIATLMLVSSILLIPHGIYSQNQSKKIKTNKIIDGFLKELEQAVDDRKRVDILNKLSSRYSGISPAEARKYADRALELSRKIDYPKGIADSYNKIGTTYRRQSEFDTALNYYFKSLKINKELGIVEKIADDYSYIGIAYSNKSEYDRALDYFFKSLKINEELGKPMAMAGNYNNIGIIYRYKGEYDRALDYFFKSLEIKKKLGKRMAMAYNYNNIGIIYDIRGDYRKAKENYFKCLEINKELGNRGEIAKNYTNIGMLFRKDGDYSTALDYHLNSLKINEELGNQWGISISYAHIGYIYMELDDYDTALDYQLKSLEINKKLGNRKYIANAYKQVGLIHERQGKYADALAYYRKSLRITKELEHPRDIASSYKSIGGIYIKQGKYADALEHYSKSLKISREIGSNPGIADSQVGIGTCYIKQGNYKEGIGNLTHALTWARKNNHPRIIRDCAENLSQGYAELNQFDKAYQYLLLFKEKSDELKNIELNKKIAEKIMAHEFKKKEREKQEEFEKKERERKDDFDRKQEKTKLELKIAQLESKERKSLNSLLMVSSILLLLLLFVTYNGFRLKKKSNIIIQGEKEKAVRANNAKSEFLTNMSHELRTPLNAVIGFSQLLSSMVTDPKQKTYTHSIRTAGKSLLKLINDILDLSKIESGMMEVNYLPVEPRRIFNEIRHIFREKTEGKGLSYITEIDESLPDSLMLDETRLRQILLNLVGNAIKFTDTGFVKLAVKRSGVKTKDFGHGLTRIDTDKRRVDIVISVEDTGKGIPPDEQDSIFEPFKQQQGQSVSKYGGTGLGLSISKRLTEMMKGRISVESEPGKGSTFTIVLENVEIPRTGAEVPREEWDDFNLDSVSFEPARVLVVDDVESNRLMLGEVLNRVNLESLTASNGEEALFTAGRVYAGCHYHGYCHAGYGRIRSHQSTKKQRQDKRHPGDCLIGVVISEAKSGDHRKRYVCGLPG